MPPNGNAVYVSEEVNSKSVDQAFIMPGEYMPNDQRSDPLTHTLADQEGGIHPDYRLLVWDKIGVDRSGSGDEGRTSKTMGGASVRVATEIFEKDKPNSGGYSDLAKEIEPTTDPRNEGCFLGGRKHSCPEIRATAGWMGTANL